MRGAQHILTDFFSIIACLVVLQVVVLSGASLEESKRINDICRTQDPAIAFIRVETRGVFASVFCDFGPSFTVYDVNGTASVTPSTLCGTIKSALQCGGVATHMQLCPSTVQLGILRLVGQC